jgi:hypothetical protein
LRRKQLEKFRAFRSIICQVKLLYSAAGTLLIKAEHVADGAHYQGDRCQALLAVDNQEFGDPTGTLRAGMVTTAPMKWVALSLTSSTG